MREITQMRVRDERRLPKACNDKIVMALNAIQGSAVAWQSFTNYLG